MAQEQIKINKRVNRAALAKYARNASPLKEGLEYAPQFDEEGIIIKEVEYTSNGNTYTYPAVECEVGEDKKYLSLNCWRGRTIAVADENGKLAEKTFEAEFAEDAPLEEVYDGLNNAEKGTIYVCVATSYRGKNERSFYASKVRVLKRKKTNT